MTVDGARGAGGRRAAMLAATAVLGLLITGCGSSGGSEGAAGEGGATASTTSAAASDAERTTVDLEGGYALSFVLPSGWEGSTCEDVVAAGEEGDPVDWRCDPDDGGMLYAFNEVGVSPVDDEGGNPNEDTCTFGSGYVYPQGEGSIEELDPSAGEAFGPHGDMVLWPFDAEGDPCPGGRLDIPAGDAYVRLRIEGPAMTEADYEGFMETVEVAPA